MKTPGAVAAKAYLRDSLKRLQMMRKRCGKDDKDAAAESTGDPFRDKTQQFMRDIGSAKEMILERNEGTKKFGQDRDAIEQSHDIGRLLRQLDHELLQIKAMVDQADRELARANKKKKKESKIALLEQQLRGRQTAYDMCVEVLAGARTLNDQRFGGGANVKKGKNAVAPTAVIGKKLTMKTQLADLTKAARNKNMGEGADGDAGGAQGGGGAGSPGVKLEDAPETAEQMKVLKEQERKINAGLDRLSKGVGRLHELAIQIGTEIDTQNQQLTEMETTVDAHNKTLKQINRRLKGLLKKAAPMNMCINVGCFLLVLSIVGYLLYQFKVI